MGLEVIVPILLIGLLAFSIDFGGGSDDSDSSSDDGASALGSDDDPESQLSITSDLLAADPIS